MRRNARRTCVTNTKELAAKVDAENSSRPLLLMLNPPSRTCIVIETLREKALEAQRANLEHLVAVCNTTLKSTDRLAALHLDAARTLVEEVNARIALPPGNGLAPHLQSLSTEAIQPMLDKANAYTHALLDVMNELQRGLASLYETRRQDMHQRIDTLLDHAHQTAPAGTEAIVPALKAAVSTARRMHDDMIAVSQQAADATHTALSTALAGTASRSAKAAAKKDEKSKKA